MGRVCGIDYGRRRVGVALSDPTGLLVSRALTVEVDGSVSARAKTIAETLAEEALASLVVGLPQKLNGSPGTLDQEVRAFASLLSSSLNLPVTFWDERLTSVEADRLLRTEGAICRKKRTRPTNTVSASLILQSYLDAHGSSSP